MSVIRLYGIVVVAVEGDAQTFENAESETQLKLAIIVPFHFQAFVTFCGVL